MSSVRRTFIPDIFLHQCCQHSLHNFSVMRRRSKSTPGPTKKIQKHHHKNTKTTPRPNGISCQAAQALAFSLFRCFVSMFTCVSCTSSKTFSYFKLICHFCQGNNTTQNETTYIHYFYTCTIFQHFQLQSRKQNSQRLRTPQRIAGFC